MLLEQTVAVTSTFAPPVDIKSLSRDFGRRYSQKVFCHLLVIGEAGLLAALAVIVLTNPFQIPTGGLRLGIVSGVGIGTIALASAMWTGAATFEYFERRLTLLPGACAAALFTSITARIGGAAWSYAAICAGAMFLGVFIIRIPTALLKASLVRVGRLTRLVAVIADDAFERDEVIAALNRCDDIVVVFAGGSTAAAANFEPLSQLSREGMLDEVMLAGEHIDADLIERIAGLVVTLARTAPSDRMELNAFNALRGTPKSRWNMQAIVLINPPLEGWGMVFKRTLDILGSLAAIALLSPILLACAVAVKLESKGPALFIQERAGYRAKPFRMFKFRSMYVECADHTGSQLTSRSDSRVTRVGNFLRRSSADELPQLFNVLRGEMSLVGPRPHPKGAKAGGVLYDVLIPSFYSRYRMIPGITGLAQISGHRGNTEIEQQLIERFRSDLRYAAEWSPIVDITILFRTVLHLVRPTNAF